MNYNTSRDERYQKNFSFCEEVVVPIDYPVGTASDIPNNKTYKTGTYRLKIYRNGIRLHPNRHYEETSSTSVRFLISLNKNDLILYEYS
jgi:hypothetical protein